MLAAPQVLLPTAQQGNQVQVQTHQLLQQEVPQLHNKEPRLPVKAIQRQRKLQTQAQEVQAQQQVQRQAQWEQLKDNRQRQRKRQTRQQPVKAAAIQM